jgi:PKD repeat protein
VEFDASESQANGGTITEYRWDFTNNGETDATGQQVTHQYGTTGKYEVKLTVEKASGATNAITEKLSLATGGDASIALENVSASTGDLASVNLTASGDIAGYTAEINFDPTEVQINTVSGEDISDPVTNLDNKQGELTITQSEGSSVTDPTLAQISLQAVGTSGTPLTFVPNETTLNNENTGLPISEYADGEVAVSRCEPGDANVNGQIGYIDGVLIKRHIAGLSAPGFDAECADISGDGDVTALDATQISQEILDNLLSTASNTGSADTGTVTTAAVSDSDTTQAATPGTSTLSVGSVGGAPGDQVTIPVSIDGSAIGYGARIEYNSEIIEVQSVEGLALDTDGAYDNSQEAIALTGSQTTVADDPGVVAEVTATIVGQQDTESAITVDKYESTSDIGSGTTLETEDGSVTVSESVAIVDPTLTPTKVGASAQTHTLSFEAVGVSADGTADEFTITMPGSVNIETVNSANITNRDNNIAASADGNTITFEANPDQPAETVDLAIELDVELSESEEVN